MKMTEWAFKTKGMGRSKTQREKKPASIREIMSTLDGLECREVGHKRSEAIWIKPKRVSNNKLGN